MDKQEIQGLLMQIFTAALKGEAVEASVKEQLTTENIPAVYSLAKKHSLGHLVTRLVFADGIEVAPEMAAKLQRDELLRIHQYERMQYTYREICAAFDEAEIAYIPLKGSVLRRYYPEETMRTSCDIDILVRETELELATGVLEAKGYRCGERHYHDVSMYSPNKIHLELHFNIQENMDSLDSVLKDAWQYAVPVDGSRHEFRKEFFVFHMYAHMAYHFLAGGCGIRSLMDIWVMEHIMNMSYSLAEGLLKKAGIYQFALQMCALANRCFEEYGISDPILTYIWRGGAYGSVKNNIIIQKRDGSGTLSYLWRRIFLPFNSMVILYPVLKKIPMLLPVCWVLRWIKALFAGKARRLSAQIEWAGSVSDDTLLEIKEICRRLGL